MTFLLVAEYKFAGKMMQVDLKAAGVEYIDAHGLYADFHALRHTFITNMMKSGVSAKTAQALARHSTIDLTMNMYTSLTVTDQAATLNQYPRSTHLQLDPIPRRHVQPG